MNDWLDYKGSGSARAYSANGLTSDSNISHAFKDNVKNTVTGFMDKVTNSNSRKNEEQSKQFEAEKRLCEAEIKKCKKDILSLRTKANKLQKDVIEVKNKAKAASTAKIKAQAASSTAEKQALDSAYKSLKADAGRVLQDFWRNYNEFKDEYERLSIHSQMLAATAPSYNLSPPNFDNVLDIFRSVDKSDIDYIHY